MKSTRNLLLILSTILALAAWLLIITPLYTFALYPAVAALLLAVIGLFMGNKQKISKMYPISLIMVAAFALLMSLIFTFAVEPRIEKDQEINQILKEEKDNAKDDLDAALDELE